MLAVLGAKTRSAQSGGAACLARKLDCERDPLRPLHRAQHATKLSISCVPPLALATM